MTTYCPLAMLVLCATVIVSVFVDASEFFDPLRERHAIDSRMGGEAKTKPSAVNDNIAAAARPVEGNTSGAVSQQPSSGNLNHHGGADAEDAYDLFLYQESGFGADEYRPMTMYNHRGSVAEKYFAAPKTRARGFSVQALSSCLVLNANKESVDLCQPHGVCNNGKCDCYDTDDGDLGHWTGDTCNQCKYGYAGPRCMIPCKGSSCNACNSHGTCNMGTSGDGSCDCWDQWSGEDCTSCAENYVGPDCSSPCPGIELNAPACFGRGLCIVDSNGQPACNCNTGFGGNCLECDSAHYGSECEFTCLGYVTTGSMAGKPCSGHGTCYNGTEVTSLSGTCVCDEWYGTQTCAKECPNRCSGHGNCSWGADNDATCTCDKVNGQERWAPPDCSRCSPAWTGPQCTEPCRANVFTGAICSDNGNCTYVNGQSKCVCSDGYDGMACEMACPGTPPCSGHGTCTYDYVTNTAKCSCFQDRIRGNWTGDICDSCLLIANNSIGCMALCPTYNGLVCNGHGRCAQGRCYCDTTSPEGKVWCNANANPYGACELSSFPDENDGCALVMCTRDWFHYGDFGTVCNSDANLCAGWNPVTQTVCNGQGYCDNGRYGKGTCTCNAGYGGAGCALRCPVNPDTGLPCTGVGNGYCITAKDAFGVDFAKCQCLTGYRGTMCEYACPIVAGVVCAGNGNCLQSGNSSARCNCTSGWTGRACNVPCLCSSAHGRCNDTICADYLSTQPCTACQCKGNFTGLCDRCLNGTQGANCEGACVHGYTLGQQCVCEDYWNTASCNVKCPFANGLVCGGHGECRGGALHDGSCRCNGTAGVAEWFGSACTTYCTVFMCKTRAVKPLLNPECRLTSDLDPEPCKCLDSDKGHWAGDSCGICAKGYWGPTCTEECECSKHGACDMNTNECQCDANDVDGFWAGTRCETCLDGYIGVNCESKNVLITRLQIETITNPSDVALRAPVAAPADSPPMPKLLNVDSDYGTLYVGSSPAFKLAARNGTLVQLEYTANPGILSQRDTNAFGVYSSTSSAPCDQGEVIFASIQVDPDSSSSSSTSSGNVYYLMQPSPNCSKPLRIVYTPRIGNNTFNNSREIWQCPSSDCDGNLRVIAAADDSNTEIKNRARILSFVAGYTSGPGGTGDPTTGGKVFHMEFRGTSVTVSSKTLPDNFIPRDIAWVQDVSVTGGSKIALGGTTISPTDGSWNWDTFMYNPSESSLISLRSELTCWPSTTGGIDPGSCSLCTAVERVRFVPAYNKPPVPPGIPKTTGDAPVSPARYLLLSIRNSTESFLAWVQDITATYQKQRIVAQDQDGTCAEYSVIVFLSSGSPRAPKLVSALGATVDARSDSYYIQVASSNEVQSNASAMAVDVKAMVAYVAYDLSMTNKPSVLGKFALNISKFGVYGKRQLRFATRSAQQTVAEVISRLTIDYKARLLYGLVQAIPSLRVITFLLYEIQYLTPDIADQRGGTNITVWGSGFQAISTNPSSLTPVPDFQIKCKFGDKEVNATILGFDRISCNATSISNDTTSVGACEGQPLEITLYGGTSWYTENHVTVQRAQSPRLESPVFPDRGGLKGGTPVTVHGQGFVSSRFATCKFYTANPDPRAPPPVTTSMIYVSPNQVICVQPRANNASWDPSLLDIALDNQIYTGNPVVYQIVGESTNIQTVAPSSIVAGRITNISISIFVVDEQGHNLRSLDFPNQWEIQVLRNITESPCDPALFTWRENDDYPNPPCRNISLNSSTFPMEPADAVWSFKTNNGTVTFNNLYFYQPRTGNIYMEFRAIANRWIATSYIQIVEGPPYALAIANRLAFVTASTFQSGTALTPIEIIIVDRLGNILDKTGSIEVTGKSYYVVNAHNTTQVVTGTIPMPRRVDGSNKIRFSDIYLTFYHDTTQYINFTSTNPVLLPTRTPPLETAVCDKRTDYKVPMTSQCLACPTQGVSCDGTQVVNVSAGWWRNGSSSANVNVYQCEDASMCIGGAAPNTPCRDGHTGPLCSLCKQGYGKSGQLCTKCPTMTESILAVTGGGLAFLVALLVWTVVTLRKDETTDLSVILRTVVNHMQATGKMSEFSVRWGGALKSIFQIQSSGSDVSFSGLASLDCLLRGSNLDYSAVFAGYMCLPILSVFMALLVYTTIRGLKLKPVITAKLRAEIQRDLDNMPNAKTGLLLHRYPFYFVAVTTFCVHMFAMYQTFITQSTSVLKCKQLFIGQYSPTGDGLSTMQPVEERFLTVDMSIPCPGGNHKFRTIALICAIGYGFGVPIVFIFGYKFMNGRIAKPELTKLMFMFLIGGYKDQYWFWQALIMVRKLILVLIIVFIEENKELQSYCGMWAMSLALILQIWFQPNEKNEHNIVESLSLAIITITLNLGLLYFWDGVIGNEWAQTLLTSCLVAITLLAICIFAYYMYQPVKETIRQGIKEVIDVIKEMLGKKPLDEEEQRKKDRKLKINTHGFGVGEDGEGGDDDAAQDTGVKVDWAGSANRGGDSRFGPSGGTMFSNRSGSRRNAETAPEVAFEEVELETRQDFSTNDGDESHGKKGGSAILVPPRRQTTVQRNESQRHRFDDHESRYADL